MWRAWLVLFSVCIVMGQTPGFTGPEACRECHRAEYDKQSGSHHAKALHRIAESPIAGVVAGIPEGGARESLEWAFGAGVQGITPVGVRDGRYFESRYSYYSQAKAWGVTFGHPARATSALGIFQDSGTISRCFSCHATGVQRSPAGPDLSVMREGVTCERCHGPGAAHVKAAKAGSSSEVLRRTLVNPGRFPARAQVEMCGECHRLPSADAVVPEPEIEDPVSVRMAPIGLMASRCFQESKGLSCLTCHDPHENARVRSDPAYTARCLTCHSETARTKSHCARPAERDCVGCHMPAAKLGQYLQFTDHRIRVVQRNR